LNFRGLGARFWPLLLLFSLVFLGGLVLQFSGPQPRLAASAISQILPPDFTPPGPLTHLPSARLNFEKLPLRFEPNQGQSSPDVNYLARGAGYGLFLSPDQAVLSLSATSAGQKDGQSSSPSIDQIDHMQIDRMQIVHMQLAGANPSAAAVGTDLLPGKSNYLIGSDPAKWHRNIPQFARVRYRDVYPGVDLVYYGNQGQLEYDFEVAPGVDPGVIALRFQGQQKPQLDKSGNLILAGSGGELRLKAPLVYQRSGAAQQPVAGRFVLRSDGEVSFGLSDYDRSRALVIDPVLTYSTYFGGAGVEACSAIAGITIAGVTSPPSGCPAVAVDSSANVYLAGSTTSANFPVLPAATSTPHAFQPALSAPPDVFVTKLNAGATAVLFSTYLGGDQVDISAGVAADSAFNVVVAGTTTSTNFPTTSTSAFQATPASAGAHAFVSVLDAAGENLLYSTYLSGNGTESARGLALDSNNKVYVIGTTTSTNQPTATSSFPATVGAIQVASLGTSQFFVSKLDPRLIGLSSLVYSTYFGGGNPTGGLTLGGGIAVDGSANVYITGGTTFQHTGSAATDFPIINAYQGCLGTPPPLTPPTTAPACTTGVTAPDAFIAKLNPAASAGAQLIYSTYLGGNGDDVGYGIAVDPNLSVYVTGSTSSTDFTLPSGTTAFQGTNGGATDAFLGKFGTPCTGSTCTTTTVPLTYFSYLGGTGTDVGLAVAVDTLQGARIAGWTTSATTFPHLNSNIQNALKGPVDAFASRIDTTATTSIALGHYGTYLGGTGADFATGIAADSKGNSYVVGETASGDFPTAVPIQASLAPPSDIFLTKLGPAVNLALTETVSPSPAGVGNNVTFTYKITNNGDLTTGVIFTDALPTSGATFVSASSSPGQTGCPATTGTVTCSVGTLNGGQSATVTVVLAPTIAGSLSDGGSVAVFGTAIPPISPAPPPAVAVVNDFSVSVSPTTTTVAAGIPASFTVTVTPTGNIPNTVTLSASGAPTGGQTTFPNGSTFTNLSSGAQSRQLIVNTTARVTTPASLFPADRPFYAALFPVSGLALLGAGIGGRKSRRRRALMAMLLGCFFALVLFQSACGSSKTTSTTTGTPAGTYNLTVTATSGSATRTQQVVLTVQ
jgi:hypothetical protein